MIITKLDFLDKRTCRIYADGKFFATIEASLAQRLNLEKGTVLTEELQEELSQASLIRKARERALYLLEGRAYCKKQLLEKVSRTNDRELTQIALDQLEEAGLIDDLSFARNLAEEYVKYRSLGKPAIISKLRQKGLSSQTISQALEDFEFPGEETATELILKRYLASLFDQKGEEKIAAALARRGYSYSQIRAAIAAAKEQTEEEEG